MNPSSLSNDGPESRTWQELFQEAVIELDLDKLQERITAVEFAIFARQQEIAGKPECRTERMAIEDALTTLLTLKRECLGFPDWETM